MIALPQNSIDPAAHELVRRVAIGAGRYRAIVLPPIDAMPLATLTTLERFASAGVVVTPASLE